MMHIRQQNFSTYTPYIVLGIVFLGSILCLWPGVMSLDAIEQYTAAKAGIYKDHHPPLMGFVWRYIDLIYAGSAPMFLLHLMLLYCATFIFVYLFNNRKFVWWYVFYPLLPNIIAYSALIVKDTGFTFCYLLAAAILTLMCVKRMQKYKYVLLSIAYILLFYGTAVKFQAKFILIFFTIGIAYCLHDYKLNRQSICTAIALFITLMYAIHLVNTKLIPNVRPQHSWQYVKIYDLSAISLALNTPTYPPFILQQANFSFDKVKQSFLTREVDPLVFGADPLIRLGATQDERDSLWHMWLQTICRHPVLYLQARLKLFSYNLTTAPCDRSNPVKFLATTSLAPVLTMPGMSKMIDSAYTVFKISLRFIWILPLVFVYTLFALKYFRYNRYAPPLLLCSLSSLTLMTVLLFFSMAATARYVFFCSCFMHLAHGLAFCLWQEVSVSKVQTQKKIQDLSIAT